MTRATGLGLVLVAVAIVMIANGCSHKNSLRPNIPPETYLFVQGQVDKVNHRVHLYWYGTDPDGEVVKFKYRWIYTPGPADPGWLTIPCAKPGTCPTDSLFTVLTGDSTSVDVRFEIRAFDNANDSDATAAFQDFVLGNIPPRVTITNPYSLTDQTYASATFRWDILDPDGGGPGLRTRIWLDGNRAGYDSTEERSFTIPSVRFLRGGTYQSGLRKVYMQAVDDGGSAGPPDSCTWYVRAPAATMRNNRGRLLVLDDIPTNGPNNTIYDGFYQGVIQNAVPSKLPAGSWSVLQPEFNSGMFRSARDFAQTLRQFEAVMWYRGQSTVISPLLQTYQDSLGAWLDAGGRLYLDGLYLVEGIHTPGALSADFMRNHLGSDFLFNNLNSFLGDSSAGWGNTGGKFGSFMRSSVYGDTLHSLLAMPANSLTQTGLRAFGVRDTSTVALWAMDGQLTPKNVGFELPVGVSVPQLNSGRMVLITLPLFSGTTVSATRLFNRILFDPPPLGLLAP